MLLGLTMMVLELIACKGHPICVCFGNLQVPRTQPKLLVEIEDDLHLFQVPEQLKGKTVYNYVGTII